MLRAASIAAFYFEHFIVFFSGALVQECKMIYFRFMKVLIVGKNSYIGTSFIRYCSLNPNYHIEEFDSRNELTHQIYSGFDVVIHLAGIAHVFAKNHERHVYEN